MKTIVAGSRNNVTYDDVEEAIKLCGWDIKKLRVFVLHKKNK